VDLAAVATGAAAPLPTMNNRHCPARSTARTGQGRMRANLPHAALRNSYRSQKTAGRPARPDPPICVTICHRTRNTTKIVTFYDKPRQFWLNAFLQACLKNTQVVVYKAFRNMRERMARSVHYKNRRKEMMNRPSTYATCKSDRTVGTGPSAGTWIKDS